MTDRSGQSTHETPPPAKTAETDNLRQSLALLNDIYREIALKAVEATKTRCPYKDARSRCTANFSCKNQFFTKAPAQRPACAGSDKLDYRTAWNS